VGCTPIDYGCLDLLPRNPSRIAFNVVQNIAAWRRTLQLWRCNGRQCGGRSWWQLRHESFRRTRNQLKGCAGQCPGYGGAEVGLLLRVGAHCVLVFPGAVAVAGMSTHSQLTGVGV